MSFNGGKDCTVLLHIFAAVLYARHTGVDLPHAVMPDVSVPSSPVQEKEPTDEQRCIWDRPLAAPPPLPHIPNLDLRDQSEHATHHEPACSPSPEPDSPTSPGVDLGTSVGSLGEVISGHLERDGNEDGHQVGHRETDEERRIRREKRRQEREALRERRRKPRQLLRSVYFTAPNPFPELEAFVLSEVELYGLDLYRFGGGMKAALAAYLGCQGGKEIKAILLGTRQNDPNGSEYRCERSEQGAASRKQGAGSSLRLQRAIRLPYSLSRCSYTGALRSGEPQVQNADIDRSRAPRTHRPQLAPSPPRAPRPGLELRRSLGVPARTRCADVHSL